MLKKAIQAARRDWCRCTSAQTSDNNRDALASAIADLDDRSRDILAQRWLMDEKATLHQLAAKYSVSAERIRQLEKNAMKKLKEAIGHDLQPA